MRPQTNKHKRQKVNDSESLLLSCLGWPWSHLAIGRNKRHFPLHRLYRGRTGQGTRRLGRVVSQGHLLRLRFINSRETYWLVVFCGGSGIYSRWCPLRWDCQLTIVDWKCWRRMGCVFCGRDCCVTTIRRAAYSLDNGPLSCGQPKYQFDRQKIKQGRRQISGHSSLF